MGNNGEINNVECSVKEADRLMNRAYESQKLFAEFYQEKIDSIVEPIARADYLYPTYRMQCYNVRGRKMKEGHAFKVWYKECSCLRRERHGEILAEYR